MICSVSRLSARNPGSTVSTDTKLRSSRAAPIVSTTARATSATTSAERSRRCARPDVEPRPDSFSVDCTSGRDAASAGTRPMNAPVTSDSANVKRDDRQARLDLADARHVRRREGEERPDSQVH